MVLLVNSLFAATMVLVLGISFVGGLLWPLPKCPSCARRAMEWIDWGVFYDPAPARNLFRCKKCDAEYARVGQTWVARGEWKDSLDQELWDELRGTR
jgi:hypothetical protein